jgi:cell division protein FtsA
VVTAAAGAVKNLTTCVARCHLDLRAIVVSPYAAGLAALVDDEMDLGVTVIDMGAGTTSLAVFFDGHVVYTDSVPIGGGHVTNDIARGLSTPSFSANMPRGSRMPLEPSIE